MSKLKKIVIYLFFLCIGMHSAFPETPEQITFSYISINEGLSQSTVFSIDQDKRGNMYKQSHAFCALGLDRGSTLHCHATG